VVKLEVGGNVVVGSVVDTCVEDWVDVEEKLGNVVGKVVVVDDETTELVSVV
jgi:hypothetical protein